MRLNLIRAVWPGVEKHCLCPIQTETVSKMLFYYFCTRINLILAKWQNASVTEKHGGASSGSMP